MTVNTLGRKPKRVVLGTHAAWADSRQVQELLRVFPACRIVNQEVGVHVYLVHNHNQLPRPNFTFGVPWPDA